MAARAGGHRPPLYSPHTLPPEALDALLIERRLADELRGHFMNVRGGEARRHVLLTGPAGIGKTHLLAAVAHGLRAAEGAGQRLRLAWLGTAAKTLADLDDLLVETARELDAPAAIAAMEAAEPAERGSRALRFIEEHAGGRWLLCVLEGFDALTDRLSAEEDARLTKRLAESPNLLLMASSRRLPAAYERRGPWKNLFRVERLNEMDYGAALDFSGKLVTQGMRDAPGFASRVRAVHHVFGGLPRFYAAWLRDGGRRMDVDAALRGLEATSPGLLDALGKVSAGERRIVEHLAGCGCPLRTRDLVRPALLTPEEAARGVENLRRLEVVQSSQVVNEAYHELRPAALRHALNIASGEERRARELLCLLESWYGKRDYERATPFPDAVMALPSDFMLAPLIRSMKAFDQGELGETMREYAAYAEWGDADQALESARTLVQERGRPWDYFARTHALMQIGNWEEALDDAEHLTRAAPDNILAWGAEGYALCRLGDAARALAPLDKACELGKRRFRRAPVYRAAALITLGRPAAAVEDSRAYLDRHKGDALGWFMQGLAEAHGARWEAALDCCKEALNADKGHHATWKLEGAVLQRMGRYHLALRSFEEAMELDGGDAETWLGRGAALSKLGKHEESVAAYGKAIQLGVGDPRLFAACAAGLLRIERWEEAAGLLGRGLRGMGPREPNAVHAACQCMSAMLACARDAAGWRGRLRDLVETYEAAERLDELGVGLAASVAGLEGAGDEKREAWRAFWADESQRFRALTLPNRLVDAAVRYLQSRDVRTLLALTQEERRLVTRLLTETGGEP